MKKEEILKELEGYIYVEDIDDLKRFDMIKYIRKDTKKFRRGGLVLYSDKSDGYILLLQGKIKWSIRYEDVEIFKKKLKKKTK